MNLTEDQLKNRLKEWKENHPCSEDAWWHVQNAIGDLVGWEDWYAKFIKSLD